MKKEPVGKKQKKHSLKESTIHDIAKVAGVSIGTVSRALNNKAGVHPKTRERVLAISRDMNVKSRAGARRKQIAIPVTDRRALVSETYAGALCSHLMLELSRRDMFGMYIGSDEIDRLSREIFDGIITTSWDESDMSVLRTIKKTPIIMARYCKHDDEFIIAGWDHRKEGMLVADHFFNRGHKRIAMLHMQSRDSFNMAVEHRWQGLVKRAKVLGMELSAGQCRIFDSRNRMAPMLKQLVADGIDGLWMPGHEYIAAEGLKILQEVIGVKVPDDISVIGSENSGVSALLQPALTTVAGPFEELVVSIIDRLEAMMIGNPDALKLTPILSTPFLIERDSVAQR